MRKLLDLVPSPAVRPRYRRWLKRALALALAVIVLTLAGIKLVEIDWHATVMVLRSTELTVLAGAVGLALPALAACASYDLIGRRITGHRLSRSRTMLISFTGYFISLNLGAIVGGLALRYRLYMPHGFRPLTIGQIIGLSILTNWMGFIVVAGLVLVIEPQAPLAGFAAGTWLRLLGAACLLAAAAYLVYCHVRGNRTLRLHSTTMIIPSLPLGVLQLALASTNWAAMGAVIAWLLPAVGWLEVMPVLMASALAGIWSHVPGGLGVTEAVFAALLGDRMPAAELVAGVLIFRGIYYFLPLLVALGGYAWLEATGGGDKAEPRRGASPSMARELQKRRGHVQGG